MDAEALHGLDAIGEFIARDNPNRARSFTHELFERVEKLADFPHFGRRSEQPGIREFVVHKHYLVSYRILSDIVQVLDIWHSARQRLH